MERNSAVVYDASVLFSASLRDLLIQLGVYAVRVELFRPRWTEEINDEWTRNVNLAMPISWRGTLEQYAGRWHRAHQGKSVVQIYDYVDIKIEKLYRMFRKRQAG